jgi:hypothetical protein
VVLAPIYGPINNFWTLGKKPTTAPSMNSIDAGEGENKKLLRVAVVDTDSSRPEQSEGKNARGEPILFDVDGDDELGREQEYWVALLEEHEGNSTCKGIPGANGARNVILGELNVDPARVPEPDVYSNLYFDHKPIVCDIGDLF